MATAMASEFLTTTEAAEIIGVSERTMREIIKAGEIGAVRFRKRVVRVPRSEIERVKAVGCSAFRSAREGEHENIGK